MSKPSLASTHPELAAEAYGWDPTLFTYGSDRKVAWKCSLGHIWDASISHRAINKSNCPICWGRTVLKGFNDLESKNPTLASEANGWDPSKVTASSSKKLSWKCKLGHVWDATVAHRTNMESGCPYCAGKKVMFGFNDLETTDPELAKEAVGWDPKTVSRGSGKKVNWKCAYGHTWSESPTRRSRGDGCPICSSHQVQAGFNDLATTNPELIPFVDGWDPTSVTAKSDKRRNWKCPLGHKWKAQVKGLSNGTRCPICSGREVLIGFNDLKSTHPELAMEAFEFDPESVSAGSNRLLKWKCSLGHVWKTAVASRVAGTGCPICSNRTVLAGFNDLATLFPQVALQAHGWDPSTVTPFSDRSFEWKCELGHVWKTQVKLRSLGNGCHFCTGWKVLAGFNDLATTNPEIARQAFEWDPTTVTRATDKKRMWICDEGHKWASRVSHRTNLQSGCPTCAKSGFDPNKPSYLYFLSHPHWEMFQIGITNDQDRRLGSHKKLGWEVIEVRGPMDGHLTQEWETSILRMLKGRGADLSNLSIVGKFDGYSEAWSKSTFVVDSIQSLMRLTEEFEEEKARLKIDKRKSKSG
jgi:hypothetical protein